MTVKSRYISFGNFLDHFEDLANMNYQRNILREMGRMSQKIISIIFKSVQSSIGDLKLYIPDVDNNTGIEDRFIILIDS